MKMKDLPKIDGPREKPDLTPFSLTPFSKIVRSLDKGL